MKTLITISILFFATLLQSQTNGQLLKKAYKKNSKEFLKQFFLNWNKEIQPVTELELSKLNNTIKQAYSVFTEYYKPQNIDSLGGSEWGNDIYKNFEFLIVQNFIKIYFTDKLFYSEQEIDDYTVDFINRNIKEDSIRQKFLKRTDGKLSDRVIEIYGPNRSKFYNRKDSLTDSIVNFRPQINCGEKLPLYMSPEYDGILNAFLGDNHLPLGAGGLMNPARSKGQSEKKKNFLENYIKIWYGHWGGYWQFYSYPKAYSITFDKQMQYARVDYRMVYEGGEAILKNYDGRWVLISAKRTWIE